MCGIAGIVNLDGQPVSRRLLEEMTASLAHRGPDGDGFYLDGPVGLGHRRLAIIDPSGGQQPMSNEDGQVWITYNGEAYNYVELQDELEQAGHRFRTRSDTEAVVHAYESWGEACLDRLRGMFALAVYDRPNGRLLLARDRLGIKPLYYGRVGSVLAFASELQALKVVFRGRLSLDPEALDNYLQWKYIPAPLTIFKEVRKLPPAHLLEWDVKTGQKRIEPYWRLRFEEEKGLSEKEWTGLLDDKIRQAVRLRLRSDVPFGAFLSGGVDSSLIVSYMAELMDQPVKTFSIGFNIGDWSEIKYAELAASQKETDHLSQIVSPDAASLLPLLVKHYGEPFGDSSAIPTYYVSQMARQAVKMVLSGDGGDEVFAGYWNYENVQAQLLSAEGFLTENEARRFWLRRWLERHRRRWRMERWQRLWDGAGPWPVCLHSRMSSHFDLEDRRRLYRPAMRQHLAERAADRDRLFGNDDLPLVSRLQRIDLQSYLPGDILTKVDIASMANSLEVRVPLLDHELVELAGRIPAGFKLNWTDSEKKVLHFERKIILRNLAKRYYPKEQIDRPKLGFALPLGPWFAGELKPWIKKRLLGSERLAAVFEPGAIRRELKTHFTSHDVSHRLWNLLFLDEWLAQNQEVRLD